MQPASSSGKKIFVFIAVTLSIMAIGLWIITRFATAEAEKDLESWKIRLNLVAGSRAAEVSTWLNRHLKTVEELATDASIQLYVSQASLADNQAITDGQRGYVFSLLSTEAERSSFHEQRAIDTIAANVKRPRRAGLAIASGDGTMNVMTTGMPLLRPEEIIFGSGTSFIALGPILADKTPLVIFGALIAPALATENGEGSSWVLGARPLDNDFLQALQQPGEQTKTSETYIVVPEENDLIVPLTPLAGGGKLGVARRDKAASFAALTPGGFDILPNYTGDDVLVVGKELSAPVPWMLVRTISTKEVLTEITSHRNNLIISLSMTALFILAGLILAWRHGVSKRLATSYQEQEKLLARNQDLSAFLQSVSDGQPAAIAAVDSDMTVRFTNKQMEEVTGIARTDLNERRLDTAFTGSIAQDLREKVKTASNGTASKMKLELGTAEALRTYQTNVLPLEAGGDTSASVLVIIRDISDLVAAQTQSENLYEQLIGTLTEIIDARDPWSKNHSRRVADVAEAIAEEIGFAEDSLDAIRISGQLVNIGKIFVPTSILTKQTPLTDEELTLVRESMQKGASLISGLDFKGPVARILAQMRENWDGSGEPEGIAGNDIDPGARILSVANAFVGMVSARAHRDGLGFDKAADILQTDAGKRYERRAVAALQNILENKDGRKRWQDFMKKADT